MCKNAPIECEAYRLICCVTCGTCIGCCNGTFLNDAKTIMAGSTVPMLTCPWFTFLHSLQVAEHFRNLFGHVTIKDCENFLIHGTSLSEHFQICTNLKEFENYLKFIFNNIVAHTKSQISLPVKLEEVNKIT